MEEVSLLLLFLKINTGNGYHFLMEGLRKGARWCPGRSLLVKTLFSNPFSRTEFKVILVFKVSRPEFVSFSQGIVERANWKFYPSARENRDRSRGRSHAEGGEKKLSCLFFLRVWRLLELAYFVCSTIPKENEELVVVYLSYVQALHLGDIMKSHAHASSTRSCAGGFACANEELARWLKSIRT